MFLATDSGDCVILIHLDLTAAFHTVDHIILLSHSKQWVGIGGIALEWFRSYLTEQTFYVSFVEFASSTTPQSCGVSQGSV